MSTIYKRGQYWWISYKDRTGRRITQSTKLTDKTSATVIKKHYDTVEKSYCLKGTPLQHSISLNSYYKEYKNGRVNKHPKTTIGNDELSFKSLQTFLKVDRYLNDIKESDLENWYNYLLKTKATATANCRLRHIKTFFNQAVKKHYLIVSPCEGITPIKETTRKIRTLTQSEVELLLASAPIDWQHLIKTALYTGARSGEICRLKKQDIDLQNHTMTITSTPKNPTKSKKFRVVPLPDHSINFFTELVSFYPTNYLLLNNKHTQWTNDWIAHGFVKYSKKSGVNCVFHDLRRTYGAWLVMAGADLVTVQDNLGHSNITVTRNHYIHLMMDHKKKQVNKLPVIV